MVTYQVPNPASYEFWFVPYRCDVALNPAKGTISRAGYVWLGLGCLAVAIGGVVMGSAGYAHHNDVFARLGTLPAAFGLVCSIVMFGRAVTAGRGTPKGLAADLGDLTGRTLDHLAAAVRNL